MWRVRIEILRTAVEKSLTAMSPSVWRVWIEICCRTGVASVRQTSPSVWRVWIEIMSVLLLAACTGSPSGWRGWIEMEFKIKSSAEDAVTLRVEGVD